MKTKLLSLLALLPALAFSQYTNGPLSTGATAGNGSAAPTGYTWSELQNDTGNTTETNTTLGSGGTYTSATGSFFVADDFTIPVGETWQISSVEVFAYQTGYTGTTSPFNTIRMIIYSGDPSVGATSVFGDDSTNRMTSSVDGMMYRVGNTVVPTATTGAPATNRKIWKVIGAAPVTLTAGTYWLSYQLQNVVVASGGFLPLVTVPGARTMPGFNAKQFNAVSNSWTDIVDGGNPTTAPDVPVAMPFIINYAVLGTNETVQLDNRVVIYPNPAKDTFSISLPKESQSKATVIEIYDMSGKIVKRMPVAENYNVSELASGTYMVKIKDGTQTKVARLIKK